VEISNSIVPRCVYKWSINPFTNPYPVYSHINRESTYGDEGLFMVVPRVPSLSIHHYWRGINRRLLNNVLPTAITQCEENVGKHDYRQGSLRFSGFEAKLAARKRRESCSHLGSIQ
jgi:hypothetical protein